MPKTKRKSQAQRRKEHRERMRLKRQEKENEIKFLGFEVNLDQQTDTSVIPTLSVTCGSTSQADPIFKHGGLQGTGICLEALRYSIIKPISQWTPGDIDKILVTGDTLFNSIVQDVPRMLRVNELPTHFKHERTIYHFQRL